MDRCRVWESNSDKKDRLTPPALGPEVPVTAVHSATDDSSPCRREWDQIVSDRYADCGATVNCELLPMLVAYLQQSVHQDIQAAPVRDTSPVSSPDVVAPLCQLRLPKDELARIPSTEMRESGMVCFSCGEAGHGVSRCSRMDTTFPFLPPGWLVDFRDGQYRAVWPTDRPGAFRLKTPVDPGGRVSLPDQQ